ncbi:IS5/IS1182 family transposase, partial [Paraburkholderia sp. EG304]
TRKREFLDEMRRVVPWSKLIALIEPHYPAGKTGRPPFPIATILTEKGLMLKAGSAVDATLIAAPSSTKNGSGTRDPEMHSTQK